MKTNRVSVSYATIYCMHTFPVTLHSCYATFLYLVATVCARHAFCLLPVAFVPSPPASHPIPHVQPRPSWVMSTLLACGAVRPCSRSNLPCHHTVTRSHSPPTFSQGFTYRYMRTRVDAMIIRSRYEGLTFRKNPGLRHAEPSYRVRKTFWLSHHSFPDSVHLTFAIINIPVFFHLLYLYCATKLVLTNHIGGAYGAPFRFSPPI